MKTSIALATTLLSASVLSHPHLTNVLGEQNLEKRQTAGQALSRAENNCGPRGPCLGFNAEAQRVSVTGEHAYRPPGKGDIRGPCPGLNAAANHGYLPRNGVPTILQTVNGLRDCFGFGTALGGFLAAYAVVLDGDILAQTWSIGGPPPFNNIAGLLSPPQGISFSHNNYEGDSSIGRNDAYLNHGDAYVSPEQQHRSHHD